MHTLLIGIDSGTQSTKALAVDAQTGEVLGTGVSGQQQGFVPLDKAGYALLTQET